MYAKRIIPCLDVKNGRVVKGVSFVNLRDAGDPVQCAVEYLSLIHIYSDACRYGDGNEHKEKTHL